jgi:hypothetical protein
MFFSNDGKEPKKNTGEVKKSELTKAQEAYLSKSNGDLNKQQKAELTQQDRKSALPKHIKKGF